MHSSHAAEISRLSSAHASAISRSRLEAGWSIDAEAGRARFFGGNRSAASVSFASPEGMKKSCRLPGLP
jgi:hypothetical protein